MSFGNSQIISSAGSSLQPTPPGPTPAAPTVSPTQLVATTGPNGFQLINGTPQILSWTAPNDGKLHRAEIFIRGINTGGVSTGGGVTATTGSVSSAVGGNQGATRQDLYNFPVFILNPGETLTIEQSAALTAGGPVTVYIEVWAS